MKLELTALLLTWVLLAAPSAAQDNATTSNTQEDVVIRIDDATAVKDVTWGDGNVTIVFQSEIPRLATVVDSNSGSSSGASRVNFQRARLNAGRTKFTMPVESTAGEQVVTVTVGQNMVKLSNPAKPILSDVNRSNVYVAALSGGAFALLWVAATFWWKKRKLRKNPQRVL